MRWAQLIVDAEARLANANVPAGPDARYLAETVSGIEGSALMVAEVSKAEARRFDELVAARARRLPLQHLMGRMWFRYLELEARPGVFVVRPETEMVVEAGLNLLRQAIAGGDVDSAPIVVDLCSGSGAIALAIATELPESSVYGVELSRPAYDLALANNARYGDRVTFVHGDALTALAELDGQVAAVVTNPPYIPASHELSPEVLADPAEALWGGGEDGLEFPLAILARAHTLLAPGGILVMEHSEEQSRTLRKAAEELGMVAIVTGRDLAGRDRFLQAGKVT